MSCRDMAEVDSVVYAIFKRRRNAEANARMPIGVNWSRSLHSIKFPKLESDEIIAVLDIVTSVPSRRVGISDDPADRELGLGSTEEKIDEVLWCRSTLGGGE